jgi:hypothetical protein
MFMVIARNDRVHETDVSETAQEAVFQKQHRKQAEHRAAPKIQKKIKSSWIRVRI